MSALRVVVGYLSYWKLYRDLENTSHKVFNAEVVGASVEIRMYGRNLLKIDKCNLLEKHRDRELSKDIL